MTIDWLNMDTKKWSYIRSQNKAWRMVKVRAPAYFSNERAMCHHEMGLVHKKEHKIYHMHHQTEYVITNGTHDISLKFIFILSKTSLMLGSPIRSGYSPLPDLSVEIKLRARWWLYRHLLPNPQNPIFI